MSNSDKIQKILNDIVSLNLAEQIELLKVLQEAFGVDDSMLKSSGNSSNSSAPEAIESTEAADPNKKVSVFLKNFDAAKKIAVLKALKDGFNLDLTKAKSAVDNYATTPVVVDMPKKEAEEKIKKVKELEASTEFEIK